MTRTSALLAVAACAAILTLSRSDRVTDSARAQEPAAKAPVPTESLDGTWELVSVIEDGTILPLDLVKQTLIQDAKVIIQGQLAAITRPDGKAHTLAFVLDSTATPKTIDLAGNEKVGSKGIYMQDKDVLMICLNGSSGSERPKVMASLPKSDTFLMTFQRVKAAKPAAVAAKPLPVIAPAPAPAIPNEDAIRKLLVGTWGHQTDTEVVKITFNSDGSYSSVKTFKKGLKKLFDGEERTSGTWKFKDGEVIQTITASKMRGVIGQVHSYKISSINDREVIYVDNQSGQRRIEWKLR